MKILTGTYEYFLDEKGRTRIPQAIKDILGENLYVGKGMGKYLAVYTEEALQETSQVAKQYQDVKRIGEEEIRLVTYYRDFFSEIAPFTSDNQKRFRIPKNLINYADLKDKILLIGNNTVLEIWSPEVYAKRYEEDVAYSRMNRK